MKETNPIYHYLDCYVFYLLIMSEAADWLIWARDAYAGNWSTLHIVQPLRHMVVPELWRLNQLI